MKSQRIDLHCDTVTMMWGKENLKCSKKSVTLQGLKESDTLIQCFAIFIPTGMIPAPVRRQIVDKLYRHIYGNFRRNLSDCGDALFQIRDFQDITYCKKSGKIGALLTIEDGGVLGASLERVGEVYKDGVRLITLTWNHENLIGFPQSKDAEKMKKGLKPFGFDVISEMERLGIVVDVSHLSDGGFWDVASCSKKPFVASHSNARAITPHPRNLSDDMIRAVAEHGGVIGLNFGPEFLSSSGGKESRISDMVRHVKHIYQTGGEAVLALGSDFDGIAGKLEVSGPQDCGKLSEALLRAGFTPRIVDAMWEKNALRVFQEILR